MYCINPVVTRENMYMCKFGGWIYLPFYLPIHSTDGMTTMKNNGLDWILVEQK